ncbi:hypothetical protein [Curtobacterium herbarum]|uniref:Uncharacterized protein n=1 Tax=Curtobacterium herbarum TaxID=150122 RepID=A0ABP4K1V8_9MICO|nr:hypothetical protein [Curtobacterium herbarum]MBM7474137.1 hypothetical protein [Curtobacterium herbarum]MCS6544539.1 hypothetical protein [Curtobacterium herbarum]
MPFLTTRRTSVGLTAAALVAGALVAPQSAGATTADPVLTELQTLAGAQSAAEIEQIVDTGRMIATYTDGTSSTIVAAVELEPGSRALSFVAPGCSADSLCMINTSNSPTAYTGVGSRTGSWKRITSAAARGRSARFTWGGGALTVGAGQINYFGSPVTMTKISR